MTLIIQILLVVLPVVLFFLILLLYNSLILIRQAEAVIIERLGKYDRILNPGLHFIIPFIDNPRKVIWSYIRKVDDKHYQKDIVTITKVDLRESIYDFPKQNVITKDNIIMQINALIYYHIIDPKAAIYEIENLPEAIEKLTQTSLRNVIGSMDLDETLESRDKINEKLRIILDEATHGWGVKVDRVELQEVAPPEDIRQAMEKQMRAERDRRAIILESEGKKRAVILEAEGIQEAQILQAKGEAQAKTIRAEAEARSIKMIQEVCPKSDPLTFLISSQYIRTLPELTKGKDDKVILIPYEAASLAGSFTYIKKLFEETKQ